MIAGWKWVYGFRLNIFLQIWTGLRRFLFAHKPGRKFESDKVGGSIRAIYLAQVRKMLRSKVGGGY